MGIAVAMEGEGDRPPPLSSPGGALRRELARSRLRGFVLAFALISPLLLFLVLNFVVPVGMILLKSVDDRELARAVPRVIESLRSWDGAALPPAEAARALLADLTAIRGTPQVSAVANRLNYDVNGYRSLILSTARRLRDVDVSDPMGALATISPEWATPAPWRAIKNASGPFTSLFLLGSVDMRHSSEGGFVRSNNDEAIFIEVFGRTFWISAVVTLFCVVLGFPVAYLLATASPAWTSLLMTMVLLPFWTALLVRTSAWVVLLQTNGVVNNALQAIGVISSPVPLVFNRVGAYIAMIHILLPFIVLPLYSVMKGINPNAVKAAVSLGANPFVAFRRVYLPQTAPGLASGMLLVFVSAIGFYITPALIGGAGDQMIGYFISQYTIETGNWGLSAALGTMLLLAISAILAAYTQVARGFTSRSR
jgi:putative spermidine/putrescine transport system permease protein